MKFDDFVGNEKILERLGSLFEAGHFPHALLLEGEQGLGKKTLARDLACTLVCRSNEKKPCLECSQCKKARAKIHPDIIEHIPSGGVASFHVDDVRNIIKDAYIRPNEAEYKVYILADAQCMNASAQNALLKILEEPPSYAVFILTATTKSSMLQTVLSRCVTLSLEGVDLGEGARYICKTTDDTDYDKARKTLELFSGNIGRALENLNASRTAELVDVCKDICLGLAKGDEYAVLTACSLLEKDRQAVVFVCDMLKSIFLQALIGADGDDVTVSKKSVSLLASSLTRKKLYNLVNECDELKRATLRNVNNALIITKICYSLFNC